MNVLLVSHQGVASGMEKAINMITGEQAGLHTIELTEAGVQEFSAELGAFLEDWKRCNKPLLILADLKGGTPYNQAVALNHSLGSEQRVFVVSGINLPMVLEALFLDENNFTMSELDRVVASSKNAIFKADPLELNNNSLDE